MEGPYAAVKLQEHLQQRGGTINPPADSVTLARAEKRLGLALPAGVRAYLLRFDGMETCDDDLMRFWSADELALTALPNEEQGLTFADYSISAHEYLVNLNTGAVQIECSPPMPDVARDWDHYVERFLTESIPLWWISSDS